VRGEGGKGRGQLGRAAKRGPAPPPAEASSGAVSSTGVRRCPAKRIPGRPSMYLPARGPRVDRHKPVEGPCLSPIPCRGKVQLPRGSGPRRKTGRTGRDRQDSGPDVRSREARAAQQQFGRRERPRLPATTTGLQRGTSTLGSSRAGVALGKAHGAPHGRKPRAHPRGRSAGRTVPVRRKIPQTFSGGGGGDCCGLGQRT